MKPHPRIRKTVKWGGAAVTALLVVAWIASMSFTVGMTAKNGRTFGLWCGTLLLGHSYWSEGSPLAGPGFRATGPYPFNPIWWIWFDLRPPRRSWALAIPVWMFLVPASLLAATAWRLDYSARRRARPNFCPKCSYDRTGLPANAICPECGTAPASAPAPIPPFPYFVLIADEGCFLQANTQRELNYFEQIDIEEMVHWAWDTQGRKYKLVWVPKEGACPELVMENGVADFRAAVNEYQKRLAVSGRNAPPFQRCDPAKLLSALKTLEQIES